jgi:hypothetical protein
VPDSPIGLTGWSLGPLNLGTSRQVVDYFWQCPFLHMLSSSTVVSKQPLIQFHSTTELHFTIAKFYNSSSTSALLKLFKTLFHLPLIVWEGPSLWNNLGTFFVYIRYWTEPLYPHSPKAINSFAKMIHTVRIIYDMVS